MKADVAFHTLPNDQKIVLLDCETAFNSLSLKEKTYAHYLSRASWYGGLTVLMQTSPESPVIFSILHKVFLAESITELKIKAYNQEVTENDFTAFLVYVCGFFSNSGNYKAYGSSKIVPNFPKEKFDNIIKESKAYKEDSNLQILWSAVKDAVYSLDDKVKIIGFGDKGINTYYSANCTEDDAKLITEFMVEQNLVAYNTRCFKKNLSGDNLKTKYEIRLSSIETSDDPIVTFEKIFKNSLFKVTRGDYNLLYVPMVENLKKAITYAPNELEIKMISKYVEYFVTGSSEEHKNCLRLWIKNKSPAVETYMGPIITYRDPVGQKAEFQGLIGIVNPDTSKKFSTLVDLAETILPKLPWGKDFELDKFSKPDFTSLDVLTWSGAFGVPLGQAAPMYEDITQNKGQKNLHFRNSIRTIDVVPFISEEDKELFDKYYLQSLEVQVGLHELLGHSSGKLFKRESDGSLNFDKEKVKNPFTGEVITNYYLEGETYDNIFGPLRAAYEECRAEGVGYYLSLDKEVLKIFGHEGSEGDDIVYVNWLTFLWMGCLALERYEPSTKKWLHAHSQGRYVLLRVCLEAGEDFVKVVETEPGKNLRLSLDRSKIYTVGKKAVGDFVNKLQFYRCTADIKAAHELFEKYSEVPETGPYPWGRWRDIILAHKQPRKIFVQPNTKIDAAGNVILKNYETTYEDFIQSWIREISNSRRI